MKNYRTLCTGDGTLIEEWLNERAADGFHLTHFAQSEDDRAMHYFLIVEKYIF